MSTHDYTKELQIATDTARSVGQFLCGAQKGNAIVKQPDGESFLDVTTQADLEAERMVIESLSTAFPEDRILSEETLTQYSPDWERVWIIDPLDGTTNYVKGLDTYAVSIALSIRGRVMVAAVSLPASRALLHAVRGHGVFCNDQPLVLAAPHDTLKQSLVSVGFPHQRELGVAEHAFGLYRDLWLSASDLRRSASAVYDGCLLAQGITGAYVTPDIKPWDIAATSLLVEEQGGATSDFEGNPLDLFRKSGDRFSTSAVFAKNKTIHSALLDTIRS